MLHVRGSDFGRQLTVEGLLGLVQTSSSQLKHFILGGSTIIASPHKIWGPQSNDLALQLRKRGVSQIVLAGMAANLCVESHLRHLLEEGFEVVVVRDATAEHGSPPATGTKRLSRTSASSQTPSGQPKTQSRGFVKAPNTH